MHGRDLRRDSERLLLTRHFFRVPFNPETFIVGAHKSSAPASLEVVDAFIDALAQNASDLLADAELLFGAERYPRAFALARLAEEEVDKIWMLLTAAVRQVHRLGDVDWKDTLRRLCDHREKSRLGIRQLALVLTLLNRREGAQLVSSAADDLSACINDLKNASLYVDLVDDTVKCPIDCIGEVESRFAIEHVKDFLLRTNTAREGMGPIASHKVCAGERIVTREAWEYTLVIFAPLMVELFETYLLGGKNVQRRAPAHRNDGTVAAPTPP